MAWALIVDGSINRTFGNADAFVHPVTGNQHPRNWLKLATSDELSDAGIIEITYSGSHKNSAYYNNTTSAPVYNSVLEQSLLHTEVVQRHYLLYKQIILQK